MAGLEDALANLWNSTVAYAPGAIAAIITLVVGLIVGRILARVVREILDKVSINRYISKTEHITLDISNIFALIIRWIVYLAFIQQAAVFLGVAIITSFVGTVIFYLGQVVSAAVAIIIGFVLAAYLKDRILSSKNLYSDITGKIVFFLVVYLSIAIGLKFITVLNTTIIDYLLLVIVGSVGIGLAIAIGFGLRDVISDLAKDYAKKYRKR